jgi:hypothetical protein
MRRSQLDEQLGLLVAHRLFHVTRIGEQHLHSSGSVKSCFAPEHCRTSDFGWARHEQHNSKLSDPDGARVKLYAKACKHHEGRNRSGISNHDAACPLTPN